ncbi:hypothetical protein D3C72_2585190 [compost metagenome]
MSDGATHGNVLWSSSNNQRAVVGSDGTVTAPSTATPGTVTITATAAGSQISSSATITVTAFGQVDVIVE